MTVEEFAKTYLEQEIKIIENSERNNCLPELTIFEKAIIYKYTEDGFEDLNEKLRVRKGQEIPIFGKLLDECLAKMPNFEGIIYRGVNLTNIELERYVLAQQNDEILTENHFISSSSSIYIGKACGKIVFKIFSQKGKNIEKVSKYPNEKEVILRYNSKFRVHTIEGDFINLIEI